jgi:hypothetical protein
MEVVMRWPGTSTLEQEGGEGEGDVAGFRWNLRARIERWEGGGGGGRVQVDPPRSSGRVVKVKVTWPGPPRSYREVEGW